MLLHVSRCGKPKVAAISRTDGHWTPPRGSKMPVAPPICRFGSHPYNYRVLDVTVRLCINSRSAGSLPAFLTFSQYSRHQPHLPSVAPALLFLKHFCPRASPASDRG